MKLHFNSASPYARKVMVCAIETGLNNRIELVDRAITPVNPDAELNADNPLGKLPALVLDNGTSLFDSRVICEYLDSQHNGPVLFPESADERWTALRRQALADGAMDAAVGTRYETALRPEEKRWDEWIKGQKDKFIRACDEFNKQADSFSEDPDIGTIAIACALGYLDFRYADTHWRDGRPELAKWYEKFSQRPSMKATAAPT